MSKSDAISWKTVGVAACCVIGTVLLAWSSWVSVSLVKQSSHEDEIKKLHSKIDHRIGVLWKEGIAPLKKYNEDNAETTHSHKSEANTQG